MLIIEWSSNECFIEWHCKKYFRVIPPYDCLREKRPPFDPKYINEQNFSHSLRCRSYEYEIHGKVIVVQWESQEWDDTSSMEEEFRRWGEEIELHDVDIKLQIEERDGFRNEEVLIHFD